MAKDNSLAGKVAVVTGAGRGIGKSIAIAFAKAGADVAICARDENEIAVTATEIAALGRQCLPIVADLADPTATRDFADQTKTRFGAIDIIVNNAGGYLERGSFADSDPDQWWRTMEVNVRGLRGRPRCAL